MKIVLVITDSKGRNLVFSVDSLKAYSLDESVKLSKQGKLESVHAVKTGQGSYIRANPNVVEDDNLDTLSISAYKLFLSLDDIKYLLSKDGYEAYKKYLTFHWRSIEERGEHVIYMDSYPLITNEQVTAKLKPYRNIVLSAAKRFSIDPYTLGAIIIDEISRVSPWEEVLDKLGKSFVGINTSAGIAQVKVETARELIQKRYYNPNPSDSKLSPKNIAKTSRAHLYTYVERARHSIYFAAARIRQTIDHWAYMTDLSDRPEILGTLYSQGLGNPKPNPRASDRGLQISQEFYLLAQKVLKS